MLEENHYYDEEGNKLGEDDDKYSFEIRIIDRGEFSSMSHNGVIPSDFGDDNSKLHSESDEISENESHKILDNYNIGEAPSIIDESRESTAHYDPDKDVIGLNLSQMKEDKNIDYHPEVTSIYVHENDHKRDHDKGTYYNRPLSEIRAVNAQAKDPSWNNCRTIFRVGALNYQRDNLEEFFKIQQ